MLFEKEFEVFGLDSITSKEISIVLPFMMDIGRVIPCSGSAKLESLKASNDTELITEATAKSSTSLTNSKINQQHQGVPSDIKISHFIHCYYLPLGSSKPLQDENLKYTEGYIGAE